MSTAALITQLSSLTHDPIGPSPASIGFMFPAIVILSCPHLDRVLLYKRLSLSSKPRVTGGQQGPESRGCAQFGMTPPVMSATSCNPVETHRDVEKRGERHHWLALHSMSGDISFVLSLTHPALIPAQGWDWELGDSCRPLSQMGFGKIVSVHNKDGQTTAFSNVANDLLKALEMEVLYCRDYSHAMNKSLSLYT